MVDERIEESSRSGAVSRVKRWREAGAYVRKVGSFEVHGVDVDEQTRCAHYHGGVDIIAIQFPCCSTYYPCYECHEAVADHPAAVWPKERFDEKAILCGACQRELTIAQYLGCASVCPFCGARFNPGCGRHAHLYFETQRGGYRVKTAQDRNGGTGCVE